MFARFALGVTTAATALTGWYARTLHHQLHTDPLTGLANRAALARAFTRRQRGARPGELVGLLLLDLDRFKHINDTHGHRVGDRVLASIATTLDHATSGGELAVRLHGDEFAVLLPHLPEVRDADAYARTLRGALDQSRVIHGHRITISASIGAAVDTVPDTNLSALLAWADSRMYSAKTDRPTPAALPAPSTHTPRLRDHRKDAA